MISLKLSELKEIIINKNLDKESIESIIKRRYIPFLEKKVIVDQIIDTCTYTKNGVVRVDLFDKQFFTDLKVLFAYYDLEDDLDVNELTEFYDLLIEGNYLNTFKKNINSNDVQILEQMIDTSLDEYVRSNNSLEGVIANSIDKLIERLPDEKNMNKLIKDLPKQINKIDPEKLKYVSEVIGWNKGNKEVENQN